MSSKMIALFALLIITTACLRPKEVNIGDSEFGFFAYDDAAVREKKKDPRIVGIVLGCVYDVKSPTKERPLDHVNFVTVTEVYHGDLRIGEQIMVTIYAEGGPTPDQVKG